MHSYWLLPVIAAVIAIEPSPTQAAQHSGTRALSKALKGRTPGTPVDCLTLSNIRSVEIIDRTGIIYETNDRTRYLNLPRAGARSLDSWDVLVSDTHSPRLCSIDVVKIVDHVSRFPKGFVSLGKFIPYTRSEPSH